MKNPRFAKNSRFLRQYTALVQKHALIAYRNPRATALQLAAVIIFMLMLLMVDRSLRANDSRDKRYQNVPTPDVTPLDVVPLCNDDIYMGKTKDCIDLIYTPNVGPLSAYAKSIVDGIAANNGNKPLTQIKPMASLDAANAFLKAYPEKVLAAVHFEEIDPASGVVRFGLQVNETVKYFKGDFQDPNFFVKLPLQAAVERESARLLARENGKTPPSTWSINYSEFPHPAINPTSIAGAAAGNFVFAAALFGFVLQLGDLVYEKERGLRQALRTMGMLDSAYWLSWLTWQTVINFFSTIALIVMGLILQFDMFIKNSFGISFMLIFTFEMAMTAMAVPLSAMLKRSTSATNLGFIIFLLGWIIQIVIAFGFPYEPSYWDDYHGVYPGVVSWMPWALLAKGLSDMGQATATSELPGLRWSERHSYCKNYYKIDLSLSKWSDRADECYANDRYKDCECVMPIDWCMGFNAVLFVGYFIIGIYLDNILPNENGVRKPIWYLFDPSYWRSQASRGGLGAVSRLPPMAPDAQTDEDVSEEEAKMRLRLQEIMGGAPTESEKAAIELFGLRKVFNNNFVAIKNSWFQIERGTLFCLLGPNGAGKSTTINCLTGVLPPTSGEAFVYGESISNAGGMDRIRASMGVCPQFDILWDRMTGREHLILYGAIKGVENAPAEADRLLETVKLTESAEVKSQGYSGGMKRRLSVAIALLGDPKVVYLDEPTTGMDPISRRYVWDIIESVKKQRAIILTTHSMEEAEILGDRIAIMARGKLQCLGNSVRLKSKFGAGYNLAISIIGAGESSAAVTTTDDALSLRAKRVSEFVKQSLGLEPFDQTRAYLSYLLPRNLHEQLPPFLRNLEAKSRELGVSDFQLSMTSLEEVFLSIARKAEMEAAQAMGARAVPGYLRDGTPVMVPIGVEETQLNGYIYKIKWAQDESGSLMVADIVPTDQVVQGAPQYAQYPGQPGQPPLNGHGYGYGNNGYGQPQYGAPQAQVAAPPAPNAQPYGYGYEGGVPAQAQPYAVTAPNPAYGYGNGNGSANGRSNGTNGSNGGHYGSPAEPQQPPVPGYQPQSNPFQPQPPAPPAQPQSNPFRR